MEKTRSVGARTTLATVAYNVNDVVALHHAKFSLILLQDLEIHCATVLIEKDELCKRIKL